MANGKTKTFGGVQITAIKLPAMRALELLTRVARPIAGLLDGYATGVPVNVLALKVFAALTPDEATVLAREIFSCATATIKGSRFDLGSDEMINEVFTGKLPDMLQALTFCVEVNFGNFIEGDASAAPAEAASDPSP